MKVSSILDQGTLVGLSHPPHRSEMPIMDAVDNDNNKTFLKNAMYMHGIWIISHKPTISYKMNAKNLYIKAS